jgi:hypothetical protein
MSLFSNLFKKKSKGEEIQFGESLNEITSFSQNINEESEQKINEDIFKASDEELENLKINNMDNKKSLLQKITDELDMFCSRDLEAKGFKDCVQNNDLLNKDMNRKLIIADFRRLMEKSIKDIELRVNEIEVRIKTYESAGMTESVSNFTSIKEEYVSYKTELISILNKDEKIFDKLQYCLLSYDIGFNNGLKNNDNELK